MIQKLSFLLLFALTFYTNVNAQVAPPPMAMPSKSNTKLVDQIISITNHEKYFMDYCTKKVLTYAKENNWSKEKTKEILGSIRFEYYSSTIYNSYAFYSKKQLIKLLDALTALSKVSNYNQPFILTNQMMQSNLDLYVEGVIEGKYVVKAP